ncbi:MAG: hypothetical protein ABEJ43_03150, partial [Haloferacaceae archaeon]
PSALWRLRRGFDSRTRTFTPPPSCDFRWFSEQREPMERVTEAGFDGGQIVLDPSKERLTSRQLDDYTEHRVRVISRRQVASRRRGVRTRYGEQPRVPPRRLLWVWDREDRADDRTRELADGDATRENEASHRETTETPVRRRVDEVGGEAWAPEIRFTTSTGGTTPEAKTV